LSRVAVIGVCLTAIAAIVLLLGLGTWQLERRVWKLNLIRQVEQRVHAAPIPAPAPLQWGAAQTDWAYRRVWTKGRLDPGRITLVQAVTDLGPGYWVMTPLRSDQGFAILVNLGFVPADDPASGYRAVLGAHDPVTIVGLVRSSEPHGGFLRANDPSAGRWYSRDVAAIAAARGISNTAPYFIDADAAANHPGWPVGGLTVIRFPNSHLIYAVTWFGLALMTAAGLGLFIRDQVRVRPGRSKGRSSLRRAAGASPPG
jgi:surfeit locus 1 family protein